MSSEMDEANEETINLDASRVEACRICLATDIKLHILQETHHTCIQSIAGFTKFEGLPNYICYECAPVLLKCNKLLEKSKTAQDTLLEIFNKNGQISKPLIEEQKKTKTNLQSELSSFILLNHDYLFEDDGEILDDVKNELDDKNNITLKNEVKEESGDESDSALYMNIIKDLSKEEEMSSDSDVEAIDVATPIIEIESDDEKMGDDFISLKSYNVKTQNAVNDLLAKNDFVPLYDKKKMRPLGLVNNKRMSAKKKPKKRRRDASPIPTHDEDKFVRRYFNIKVINKPDRSTSKQYFCKYCPEKYNYVDNARDHVILGCQKYIPPPAELEPAGNAEASHPTVWKVWPGGSK